MFKLLYAFENRYFFSFWPKLITHIMYENEVIFVRCWNSLNHTFSQFYEWIIIEALHEQRKSKKATINKHTHEIFGSTLNFWALIIGKAFFSVMSITSLVSLANSYNSATASPAVILRSTSAFLSRSCSKPRCLEKFL